MPDRPIVTAGDSELADTEVDLYDLRTGQLAVRIYLPLDVGVVAAILSAAAANGFGFRHELDGESGRDVDPT